MVVYNFQHSFTSNLALFEVCSKTAEPICTA